MSPSHALTEASEELGRIVQSKAFRRAKKLRELLTYLFEQGSSSRTLTESDVASHVFQDSNYEPDEKSKVRVGMRSLRAKLDKYYSTEGRDAIGEIRVPTREYRAEFQLRPPAKTKFKSFARLFAAMCHELTDAEKDGRVREWLKTSAAAAEAEFLQSTGLTSLQTVTWAAVKEGLTHREIDFAALAPLIQSCGIHQILLDSLRAQETTKSFINLDLQAGFFPVGRKNIKPYGKDVVYSMPRFRLAKADAAFVRLAMEKNGGYSDSHAHPGDELMLVLKGAVEIRFEHSGVRTTLKQGDFIHFYAEQRHMAVSKARDSWLFIVRFYEVTEKFMRQKIRHEVKYHLGALAKKFDPLVLGWVRQAIENEWIENPEMVHDRVGLARLLKCVREQRHRDISTLVSKAGYQGVDIRDKENWLQALEEAHGDVTKEQLKDLAKIYEVEPMLFHCFLYPAVSNVVVVRSEEKGDLQRVESQDLDSGVSYWVPRRNLACSDIAIAKLGLDAGTAGPWNSHPGFELLIPIKGEATVYFGPTGQPTRMGVVSASAYLFAHYRSTEEHRVVNEGAESASLLIVRFYRDGSE